MDILQFERLAKASIEVAASDPVQSLKMSQAALELWKTNPQDTFADFALLQGRFTRFVKLRRRMTRARATALLSSGSLEDVIDYVEEGLHDYPEDPVLTQVLCDATAGGGLDRAGASAVLRRPLRHNLPPPEERDLIGREEALAHVRQVLQPYPLSQYPTLTIDGVGGVGKTTLVKKVAYSYLERSQAGPDDPGFAAIVWTSAKRTVLGEKVSEVNPTLRNLEDIYSAIATTLGRSDVLATPADSHDRLIRELLSNQDQRVLLVIDNLETVDDDRVIRFLRDCPAPTKRLITTRHRVEGALPLRLEGLSPNDARLLAVDTANQKGLALPEGLLADIANAAGGIPLAIIWTVAKISKTHDHQAAIRQLRSASGDYAQFCFRDSLSLLESTGRRYEIELLFALSLFAENASREALGHVCRLNDRPAERDTALTTLTDLSLVNFEDGRYSLLPLTRDFITGEVGRDLDLREPTIDRWLEWHRRLTARAAAGGADLDSKILEILRREHTNILWAIDYAMRTDRAEDFVALIRSMEFFWLGEGLWGEFDHYLDRARTLAPRPDDKIHFTARLIWLSVLRDDLVSAEEMQQAAELLLRRFDVPYERMRVEDFAGQLHMARGDLERAEAHLAASLALARELNDRRGQFACLKYLGELWCERGNAREARTHLEAAEQFVGDPGDIQWLRGLAHTSQLEGRIGEVSGDWQAAEAAYRECLRLLGFHPDARLQTRASEGLARALHEQGELEEALDELRDARTGYELLGLWMRAEARQARMDCWSSGEGS